MSHLKLPPRWKKCPRKGHILAERFLPFKTPLDEKYHSQLSPVEYFTPSMVLSLQKSNNYQIGLWIDLTNTNRFYDKASIESPSLRYLKINCKGRSECPSVDQTRLFINICSNFIAKNPSKIIAVHCTHGFNRTGFLIAAFLCENFDWSVDAAVSTFSNCRPPGIYKESYIKELFARYGDVNDLPPPPQMPAWCFEEEGDNEAEDDDGEAMSDEQNGRKRGRELNKKDAKFMEGVPGIECVQDPQKRSALQRKIQQMCGWTGNGFPGSQPVSMSHSNIALLQQKPYKVSWKADGTRYMMLIDGKDEVYFADRDFTIFQVVEGCPLFPRRKNMDEHIKDTLLDGEMVVDVVDEVAYPRYLAYDIVKFEGLDVGGTHFDRRAFCINKEIIGPREQAKREGRIDRTTESFSVRFKEFWDIQLTASLFSEKFTRNLGHDIDGLIFQPVPDAYKAGQSPDVLKWKPHTLNSIDFRCRIVREHQQGMLPETYACLFAGRHPYPFAKVKATREFRDSDKRIVECTWDYEKRTWKFLRIRNDKSFPNSVDTACSVFETIKTPLTKDHLLNFIENYRWTPKTTNNSQQSYQVATTSKRGHDTELMPPPKRPHH